MPTEPKHRNRIRELLQGSADPMSAADLERDTGASKQSVSKELTRLRTDGAIVEAGKTATGGKLYRWKGAGSGPRMAAQGQQRTSEGATIQLTHLIPPNPRPGQEVELRFKVIEVRYFEGGHEVVLDDGAGGRIPVVRTET